MLDLANLREPIYHFFGELANSVADETGFVRRRSKVSGAHWLRTWVLGLLETPTASLNELAQFSADLGVGLTAQGLDARLTAPVERFMATMFRRALDLFRTAQELPVEILQRFTGVYLLDSTFIALPAKLQAAFPASGGAGPEAGLKLQVMLELLRGQWTLTVEAGHQPDQSYLPETLGEPGSLRIGDLGYFNLETFAALDRRTAYFLSRYHQSVQVYETATSPALDLVAWLACSRDRIREAVIYLGRAARLPVRLIACPLPQAVADQRRRRAQADARRKGRTVGAKQLALLGWHLYVTNVPPDRLTAPEVLQLYRVRWQIELVFKVWKSEAWLTRIAGRQRARVLCELYAKLIGVTLAQLWTAPLRWGRGELSLPKVFQSLQRHALRLAQSVAHGDELQHWLTRLQTVWLTFGCKNRRVSRLSSLQDLQRLAPGRGPA